MEKKYEEVTFEQFVQGTTKAGAVAAQAARLLFPHRDDSAAGYLQAILDNLEGRDPTDRGTCARFGDKRALAGAR